MWNRDRTVVLLGVSLESVSGCYAFLKETVEIIVLVVICWWGRKTGGAVPHLWAVTKLICKLEYGLAKIC